MDGQLERLVRNTAGKNETVHFLFDLLGYPHCKLITRAAIGKNLQ